MPSRPSFPVARVVALATLIGSLRLHAQLPTPMLANPVTAAEGQPPAPGGDTTPSAANQDSFAEDCKKRLLAKQGPPSSGKAVSVGCWRAWHRLRTSQEADRWFGGAAVGDGVALTVGRGAGSVYTELLADNLWIMALTGYARVGVGVQASSGATDAPVAGTGTTPQESTRAPTTIDQLFQGGGNALLHVTFRGPFWMNYVHDMSKDAPPVRRIDTFLVLSTGMDLPELGQDVQSRAGYVRLAYTGDFTWRTFTDSFRFLTQFSVDAVSGFNQAFYTNLTGNPATMRPDAMLLGRLNVGMEVGGLVRITASRGWSTLADEGVRQPVRLSVQFVKRLKKS